MLDIIILKVIISLNYQNFQSLKAGDPFYERSSNTRFSLSYRVNLTLRRTKCFRFNQGANQSKLIKAFPAVITAGICDSILISLAVIGVSLVLMSLPLLQIVIYIIGLIFLLYMAWTLWNETPDLLNKKVDYLQQNK